MWGRSRSQKEAVSTFRSITNASERTAVEYLRRHKYSLDAAVDDYFASTATAARGSSKDSKENEKLFEKYKAIGIKEGGDADVDAIQGDGMMALVEDLGLDPMNVLVFVICWKLAVKEQFHISRSEFLNGLMDARVDGLSQFKAKLPQWEEELENSAKFKNFHSYVFEYTRAPEAKSIPLEIAVPTWRIVIGDRYKYMEDWLAFLETEYKKAISRDTWQQFYEFTQTIKTDFSNYDEDSAWPVVIDEFVDYMKKKL